jgi:hypothetical protein
MRRIMLAVTACAVLLVVSIVSPAVGGPSVSKVAKKASKALKLAKSATGKADSAIRNAQSARSAALVAQARADDANRKSDQAMARPVVTVGGITTVKNTAPVAPASTAVISAACPAGQRVISGGVVSDVSVGGTWIDVATEGRTGWIGAAEDLPGGSGGTLTVEAYCAPAGQATAASRTAVLRKIKREVQAYRNSR